MASKLLTAKQPSEAKLSRAIELLNKALEHDPNYAHAYKTLGLALWKRQDWPGTRQAFLKYLELLPQAADRETIEDYLKELPES
jgi:tetratricopeptide (TPR) repeat protein